MKNLFSFIILFLLSFVMYVAIDLIWLGVIMKSFYINQLNGIGRMMNGTLAPCWFSALLAWGLIVLGLLVFVLPKVEHASYVNAFMYGALFSLIIYGSYGFTNYAIVQKWPLSVVLVDIAWGSFLNGIMAILFRYITLIKLFNH